MIGTKCKRTICLLKLLLEWALHRYGSSGITWRFQKTSFLKLNSKCHLTEWLLNLNCILFGGRVNCGIRYLFSMFLFYLFGYFVGQTFVTGKCTVLHTYTPPPPFMLRDKKRKKPFLLTTKWADLCSAKCTVDTILAAGEFLCLVSTIIDMTTYCTAISGKGSLISSI